MVRVSVTIQSNRFPGLAAKLPGAARAAVAKAVADVEAQAKVRAPVDTGALRNSIAGAMTGEAEGQVAVGVDYGHFVEYGTVHMAAQPFMHPAADAVRPSFEAAIKQAIAGL